MTRSEEADLEWETRKQVRKGLFCKNIIYTLYHAIEIKELNKKKEHLWKVPTLKKLRESGMGQWSLSLAQGSFFCVRAFLMVQY